jgi:hypothetical protein
MLRTLTAFVLVAALAPAALSQTEPAWNRRISDVRIVHPPGTPPGTWRAEVQLGLLISDMAPQPADLSLDIVCRINGNPFAAEGVTVTPQAFPNACMFQCPSTVCNQLSVASLSSGTVAMLSQFCWDPPGPTYDCNCWLEGHWWPWYYDFVISPGDVIEFELAARSGALPELDTSDDRISFHGWEHAPGVDYCFGEGSSVACPCGNTGVIGNGCGNSVNAAGGNLLATGNGSVSGDTVVLTGSGMPNGSVLYFQGTSQLGGGQGVRSATASVASAARWCASGRRRTWAARRSTRRAPTCRSRSRAEFPRPAARATTRPGTATRRRSARRRRST